MVRTREVGASEKRIFFSVLLSAIFEAGEKGRSGHSATRRGNILKFKRLWVDSASREGVLNKKNQKCVDTEESVVAHNAHRGGADRQNNPA
ncbi:hypothetical protein FRC98_03590 [Lujinxingia vulgaris]|uniref:Uncharacterized protein n=1 Tax=Lujinxingia vulgaris TaxID=2600176 RepID=A0A5C6XPF3_9DELT|nr:hypothetical protein [Lujinxingia vulgaris]TXD39492.1 hypothetical protein FRC98_03590 [Lujinxingia vulgaris]